MTLIDFIKSINDNKQNLIRSSDAPEMATKLYPQFPIARLLSYDKSLVSLLNEFNKYPLANDCHYEAMLYAVPKGRRFNKLAKPEKSDYAKKLVEIYGLSYEKAQEVCYTLGQKQLDSLVVERNYGGVTK
jgi:hypothetical protein